MFLFQSKRINHTEISQMKAAPLFSYLAFLSRFKAALVNLYWSFISRSSQGCSFPSSLDLPAFWNGLKQVRKVSIRCWKRSLSDLCSLTCDIFSKRSSLIFVTCLLSGYSVATPLPQHHRWLRQAQPPNTHKGKVFTWTSQENLGWSLYHDQTELPFSIVRLIFPFLPTYRTLINEFQTLIN